MDPDESAVPNWHRHTDLVCQTDDCGELVYPSAVCALDADIACDLPSRIRCPRHRGLD